MDAQLRDDGSVLVPLDSGINLTFVPTEPGRYRLHIDDPLGAHYSLPLTAGDVRSVRDATGMLALGHLQAVTLTDLLNRGAA